MQNSKADPRVIKTQNNLKNALIKLMKTYKIDNISVQKITETASITRGTFYLHYKDKHDFIERAMGGVLADLFEYAMVDVYELAGHSYPNGIKVISVLKAYKYIENESEAFEILMTNPENAMFFDRLSDEMVRKLQVFLGQIKADYVDIRVPSDIQIAFVVSAELGLIKYWLQQGMIYTPKYMAQSVGKTMSQMKHEGVFFTDFFYTGSDVLGS